MPEHDGWEILEDEKDPEKKRVLGRGGQGTVYLARSPKWAEQRRVLEQTIRAQLVQSGSGQYRPVELAKSLLQLGNPDPVENLGALKEFEIPSADKEEQASGGVEALGVQRWETAVPS